MVCRDACEARSLSALHPGVLPATNLPSHPPALAVQLAFLLPADHGMDLGSAAVSLVDTFGQPLSAGPMPLSALCVEPCSAPAPAGLAAGLRRLLLDAAGAAEGSGAGGPGGGADRQRSSSSADQQQVPGLSLSRGLRLRKLAEHADRFELELGVEEQVEGRSRTMQGWAAGPA